MTKREIKNLIEKTFEGVILEDGISLIETKFNDGYGEGVSNGEYRKLMHHEIKKNWKEIPTDQLDDADCLVFLDAKGFRYYIPALMIRLLEDYDSHSDAYTLGILYPKKEDDSIIYKLLTKEQNQAIALFMKTLPNLVELTIGDNRLVKRAFERYWSKFLS